MPSAPQYEDAYGIEASNQPRIDFAESKPLSQHSEASLSKQDISPEFLEAAQVRGASQQLACHVSRRLSPFHVLAGADELGASRAAAHIA
jgi:hypothetical protein